MPFFGGWLREFGSEVPACATRNASGALFSAVPIKVKPAGFSLRVNASNIDVRRTIETATGVGSGAGIPNHRTASGEQHR